MFSCGHRNFSADHARDAVRVVAWNGLSIHGCFVRADDRYSLIVDEPQRGLGIIGRQPYDFTAIAHKMARTQPSLQVYKNRCSSPSGARVSGAGPS